MWLAATRGEAEQFAGPAVTTNAFLVPTGEGTLLIVGWRGAKKSSLNSTYSGTNNGHSVGRSGREDLLGHFP